MYTKVYKNEKIAGTVLSFAKNGKIAGKFKSEKRKTAIDFCRWLF